MQLKRLLCKDGWWGSTTARYENVVVERLSRLRRGGTTDLKMGCVSVTSDGWIEAIYVSNI